MTGEIALGGVYVPTLLLLALVALVLTWVVTRLFGAAGLYRFLAYRGFTGSQISHVLDHWHSVSQYV